MFVPGARVSASGQAENRMSEWSPELTAMVNSIENAMDEINSAAARAEELDYAEFGAWLEWLSEELQDLLLNVLQASEPDVDELLAS
jgi:hypothetical protein